MTFTAEMSTLPLCCKKHTRQSFFFQGLGQFGDNDDVDCDDVTVMMEAVKALVKLCGALVRKNL